MHNLEEILIWKRAIDLSKEVYSLSSKLPSEEKFGLISQIRRSVISIASNIAEGAGRNSNNEFSHFLGIAQGSSFELMTQLIICKELNMLDKNEVDEILKELKEIQKMNRAFQNTLKSKSNI